jgi:hypothetical protein
MLKRVCASIIAPIAALAFASTASAAPSTAEVKAACAAGFTTPCKEAIIAHIEPGTRAAGKNAVRLSRQLAFTPGMSGVLIGMNGYVQSQKSGLGRGPVRAVLMNSISAAKINLETMEAAVDSKRIGSPN